MFEMQTVQRVLKGNLDFFFFYNPSKPFSRRKVFSDSAVQLDHEHLAQLQIKVLSVL